MNDQTFNVKKWTNNLDISFRSILTGQNRLTYGTEKKSPPLYNPRLVLFRDKIKR